VHAQHGSASPHFAPSDPQPGITCRTQTPGHVTRRAPHPGEHNTEVFSGLLGVDEPELERLREAGAI
jgi:crotonobetainyl-CoA:carnitine CoA-transferase CaiB-like acyl-CoA transferase